MSGYVLRMIEIASIAHPVRSVISAHGMPFSTSILPRGTVSSARLLAITGIIF